jgi:hypothetical protein
VSGYWLIVAPAAVAALAGVVVLSRRMAYRPQHAAAYRGELADDWPAVGSMNLDDERAGRLGTWTPRPDPWPQGWPQADGWTGDDLADLHAAPTVLDDRWEERDEAEERAWTAEENQPGGYGGEFDPDEDEGRPPWEPEPEPELPEQLARVLREQLGRVDQLEPADRLTEILGQLEPLPLEPAAADAPWYDGAWLDGQLAALFAWVRAVRELA